MKKYVIVAFALSLLSLVGCVNVGKYVAYQDENIPSTVKVEAHKISDEIMESFENNNENVLESYFYKSDQSTEGVDGISEIYAIYNSALKDVEFRLLTEYYSPSKASMFMIPSLLDEYSMNIAIDNHEAYLLVYSGENIAKELTISTVMIKTDEGWKVLRCDFGMIRAAGSSANEWAKKANEFYEKGQIVSSVLHYQIASELSQLGPTIIHTDQKEIIDRFEKAREELNKTYSFPIVVELSNAKKVELVGVGIGFIAGEFSYTVNYETNYTITDENSTLIEEESSELHNKVLELFPGFENGIGYVVYKAYEELPVKTNEYQSYGTVIEIENTN